MSQPSVPTDTPVEPTSSESKSWIKANGFQFITTAAMIGLVCYFLHPFDVLLVIVGLGGIIFIHELGHFLAAKACHVKVSTFAIGFGPPLPFCHFKYGETQYKLAMIPLGGYVMMAGETSGEIDRANIEEEDDTDPRNFKNQSVWERMLIISAGVIMNIILAIICFIVAYTNGVEEQPAIVQAVDPGSAAWMQGLRPGEKITRLNSLENPWFDDIRPIISATDANETVAIDTEFRGEKRTYQMAPLRSEGALYPVIGVVPINSMTLIYSRRDKIPPYTPGSVVAQATGSDGAGFLPGDKLIGMSAIDNPDVVTPLLENADGYPGAQFDYTNRLSALAGKTIKIHVLRKDQAEDTAPIEIVVPPAYRQDLGLRMKAGPISAIRVGSPAANSKIVAQQTDGDEVLTDGDTLLAVEVQDTQGQQQRFQIGQAKFPAPGTSTVQEIDPLRLPTELNRWAAEQAKQSKPNWAVKVYLKRPRIEEVVVIECQWQDEYREVDSLRVSPSSPVPVGGLGLAYLVTSTVQSIVPGSAADQAGLQSNDQITEVRFTGIGLDGEPSPGRWGDVLPNQWAFLDQSLQRIPPHRVDFKIQRGEETLEVLNIAATPDETWPMPAVGLDFDKNLQKLQADSIGESLQLGFRRTVRMVRGTYQGLYSLVFGRVSVKMMQGPISLARISYLVAGQSPWKLILLVALISINLAVVNFLPIPMLDGGHMVFLIYELIRGKPAPESVQHYLTLAGVAFVLCLMAFVIGLDIWRLFF